MKNGKMTKAIVCIAIVAAIVVALCVVSLFVKDQFTPKETEETTAPTETETEAVTQAPTETEAPTEPLTNGVFEYGENGLLKGSVTDCTEFTITVDDDTFTPKEYFANSEYYYNKWCDEYAEQIVDAYSDKPSAICKVLGIPSAVNDEKFDLDFKPFLFMIAQHPYYSEIDESKLSEINSSVYGIYPYADYSYDDIISKFGIPTSTVGDKDVFDRGYMGGLVYEFEDQSQIEISFLDYKIHYVMLYDTVH